MTKIGRPLKEDIDVGRGRDSPSAASVVDDGRDDATVALAVRHALGNALFIPQTVTASVEQGQVTLRGSVTQGYQRDAALRIIGDLDGVRSVVDSIAIEPEPVGTLDEPR